MKKLVLFLILLMVPAVSGAWSINPFTNEDKAVVDEAMIKFSDVSDLSSMETSGFSGSRLAFVEGFNFTGDGGGGNYIWDATSTETAVAGVIIGSGIGRWKLIHNGTIRAEQMGCISDYDVSTHTGTDNRVVMSAFLQYCSDNGFIADLGSGKYYVLVTPFCGATVTDISSLTIISTGAEIYTQDASTLNGSALCLNGDDLDVADAGRWYSISQSVPETANYIVCEALADEVSPGDVVQIFSEEPATPLVDYQEDSGRGEMATVRNVVGDIIFFQEALRHSYSISDWTDYREDPAVSASANVRAAKVNVGRLNIVGSLSVINPTTTYSTPNNSCSGVDMEYLTGKIDNLIIKNFPQRGISLDSCYGLSISVDIDGAVRSSYDSGDGGPGYGVDIVNMCKDVTVKGIVRGSRHGVAVNTLRGVSWGTKIIDMVVYCSRGNVAYDCHSPSGSIDLINCTAIGGRIVRIEESLTKTPSTVDTTSTDILGGGFSIGAMYTNIDGFNAINCGFVAQPRGNIYVEKIYMNNISSNNGANIETPGITNGRINDIELTNINCDVAITLDGIYDDKISIRNLNGGLELGGTSPPYTDYYIRVYDSIIDNCTIADQFFENIYFYSCHFSVTPEFGDKYKYYACTYGDSAVDITKEIFHAASTEKDSRLISGSIDMVAIPDNTATTFLSFTSTLPNNANTDYCSVIVEFYGEFHTKVGASRRNSSPFKAIFFLDRLRGLTAQFYSQSVEAHQFMYYSTDGYHVDLTPSMFTASITGGATETQTIDIQFTQDYDDTIDAASLDGRYIINSIGNNPDIFFNIQ